MLFLCFFLFLFFLYLGFLLRTFTNHRTAEEGGGHFNSSLPLPPASQALRHWPGNYCRELTSAHRQQSDSNQEPLVSERKSLTTKLHALLFLFVLQFLEERKFIGKKKSGISLTTRRPMACCSLKNPSQKPPVQLSSLFYYFLIK